MPSCMKCHKPVLAARVICGDCEKRNAETITALETAACGTCYRLGRDEKDHECQTCEPMRLIQKLKKEWC